MGRPTRLQFPGACYHVTLRGNNRQAIFLSNQDRRIFLTLLRTYKERYGLKVFAYCLSANSAQLLLETPGANLSKVMQGLNTSYTKHFNREHNTVGHVFQGRYKALLVDKDRYLVELTGRIHMAPVREGLSDKPWRYLWSSCAAYVESKTREPLIDSEAALSRFAKNRLTQSVRYLQYMKEQAKSPETELPAVGAFIGGRDFADSARKAAGSAAIPSRDPDAAKPILAQVLSKHGVDEEKLLGRGKWRVVSSARREAFHRLWKEAGLGVSEIARMFRRTPSAVSQAIRSLELEGKTR
ncbi:MAG: transposase [Elusimicrobiota bacterium]